MYIIVCRVVNRFCKRTFLKKKILTIMLAIVNEGSSLTNITKVRRQRRVVVNDR